jgi:hypothetical protein
MPRTGARADALSTLLTAAGFQPVAKPAAPRVHTDALALLYRQLGGIREDPTLRPGSWDLAVAAIDGSVIVIELDEELHFNRYREQTLAAPWYDNTAWSPEYSTLCKQHERRCLQAGAWGKRWTTPSCEKLFGQGGPAGQVAGAGAPRWKQRALYDAIKDLAAISGDGPRLARLSIYDQLDGRELEAQLQRPAQSDPAALMDLVNRRMI